MEYKNKILGTSTVIASLFMTGCLGINNKPEPVQIHPIAEDIIKQNESEDPIESLKQLSIEARDELRLLAKASQAMAQQSMTKEQHEQKSFQALYVPAGFEQMVTIKYTGPIEEAARIIAEAAGYEFHVYGKKPSLSFFVNIDLNNKPLNDGLKELGLQTGDSADIELYEKGKLIVLNYNG